MRLHGLVIGFLNDEVNMAKTFKPGEEAPRSGQYRIVGTPNEVTATRGKPLPPTPHSGQRFKLVDPTKHGSGK